MFTELITVVCLFGVYASYVVAKWACRRRRIHQVFRERGIPGPKPSFLDGNLNDLKSAPTPNDVISRWLKEYGPVFGYFIGGTPHLVVNDLELIKRVTIKDFNFFPNRADPYLEVKPLIHSVMVLKNQRWKEVRSVLTPTFSSGKIKLMNGIMNKKVDITVDVVMERSVRDEAFDMYDIVQALTLDVIAECGLAMRVNCQKDHKDPFFVAAKTFFRHAQNRVVEYAIMFPFVAKILTFISHYVTAGLMTTMIVNNVSQVIKCRRNNPQLRRTDLLQLMLDSAATNPNDDSGKKVRLTDDELIGNAYLFLLAGYETTGTALALAFWLLTQHPGIQERLYEEITRLCPDGDVSYDCLKSMTYLDQVFTESLRLYPPVTGFITRKCEEDRELGGFRVPKGTVVVAPIWDVQHDPEIWPDPWTFDPERFAAGNRVRIPSAAFFPFGLGPRNCIGMRFAQFEAKLALAKLVRRFRFVPCEMTENRLTFICPTVINNPANGVYLKAILRDDNS